MKYRTATHIIIILLFIVTLFVIFAYGPRQRIQLYKPMTATINNGSELNQLWHKTGVHGRIAVLFTRHLKPQQDFRFPEFDYLDTALQEGIVRKVYFIVPDAVWVVSMVEILQDQSVIIVPRKNNADSILLHRGGRIHIIPLSQYIPEKETSLVVYEPSFWNDQEQIKIEEMLATKQLNTDLLVTVR